MTAHKTLARAIAAINRKYMIPRTKKEAQEAARTMQAARSAMKARHALELMEHRTKRRWEASCFEEDRRVALGRIAGHPSRDCRAFGVNINRPPLASCRACGKQRGHVVNYAATTGRGTRIVGCGGSDPYDPA